MSALRVVLSAAALRSLPMIAGVMIARSRGAASFADFVLAMSLLNLVGSVFQLGIVPQVISSRADSSSGVFEARLGVIAVWLFGVTALILLSAGAFRIGDTSVYVFAAGASVGLLAASLASAMLCRIQEFRSLARQSALFLGSATVWMLVTVVPGARLIVPLWMAGLLIAAAGLVWMHATVQRQLGRWRAPQGSPDKWRSFFINAAFSAAFGTATMLGYYLGNVRATDIPDPQLRGSAALGLQMLALVVFVPSALSSYFVPRIRQLGDGQSSRRFFVQAARSYLLIGLGAATACLVLLPVLAMAWGLEVGRDAVVGFAVLMLAAVLAATNAVFNQLFVSLRAFGIQALFACFWLGVVVSVLYWTPPSVANIGLALAVGYAALLASLVLYASRGGFSRAWER